MSEACDFWVCIHQAANSVEREGKTFDDRVTNIVTSFRSLPPLAREEVAASFLILSDVFKSIDSAVLAPRNDYHAGHGQR
jgi:hypothetical protein